MNKFPEIERKMEENGYLKKYQPMRYTNNLRQVLSEIQDMISKGFVIDKVGIMKQVKECDQKIKKLNQIDSRKALL